ncbi:hypothetical protein B0I35DRAFT_473173 [Stachybotrys elegans]|uniref:Uncharacterized protein n=1 Tax=Stachybotrys elegans TaxID=80388 RepID=A0A8K0WWA5_9HYPO|nr:hypothetical protein B0I35DRAFT_473173 [Stachybotrys elegans]
MSRSALRPLGELLASKAGPVSLLPSRAFSTSQSHALRATFSETENPELNATLKEIQEKIVFPGYLPTEQKERVFDVKNRSVLEKNPVILELDDIEYKFPPLNVMKDIPNSKKIYRDAIKQMKTPQDWDNFAVLLAGYKKASIKLKPSDYALAARRAAGTGNITAILECIKQEDKTGFPLELESAHRMLHVINQSKILESSGAKSQTTQASKWCETLLDLDARRVGGKGYHQVAFAPLFSGMVLFNKLCAVKVGHIDASIAADQVRLVKSIWDRVDRDPGNFKKGPYNDNYKKLPGIPYVVSMYMHAEMDGQVLRAISLAKELGIEEAGSLAFIEDILDTWVPTKAAPGAEQQYKEKVEITRNLPLDGTA